MNSINKTILHNFYYKLHEKTHSYSKRMEGDAANNIWETLKANMWEMDKNYEINKE